MSNTDATLSLSPVSNASEIVEWRLTADDGEARKTFNLTPQQFSELMATRTVRTVAESSKSWLG